MPLLLLLFAGLLLGGCQHVITKSSPVAGQQVESAGAPKLPYPQPAAGAQELDEDLLYSFLVGEIGVRSGDLEDALKYYLHAAMLGRSAYAAERATRVALHLKDYQRGLRAARRWIELAPNSITARQLGALLFLRNGQPELAQQQFEAVLRIAEALGKDGMLQVAAALSAEPDSANALHVMQALVAQQPDDAHAQYAMAVVETAHQQYGEAETSLREAIRLKPDWAQPQVLLSRVLVTLGHAQQALQQLAAVVERYPDDKLLRTSYARLLVSQEQYPKALQQFRTLVRQSPKDNELRYGYAMLATQQHQWDQARRLWQQLRGEQRYRNEATYFLAQVEESEDHRDLAIGLYRSIGSGELKVDAAIRMASLLAESGRLDGAREALKDARIADPGRAVDLYLAEAQLLQQAKAPRAQVDALYKTAIAAHPEDNDLLYNRGLYYSEIGAYKAMEADFKKVLARDPDNANALNALGYTLADTNQRLDEAYGYIRRALKLKPDNRAILDSLGWVYYRMGDFSNALKYLRSANQGEPDDEIAAHLGEVLWVSGSTDEARKVLQQALQQAPQSAQLRAVMDRFLDHQ